MEDVKLIIKVSKEDYERLKEYKKAPFCSLTSRTYEAIANGVTLTPDILADLLMEERIRGELKQDISYSKDIINDVRCRLTVDIIDHRPCYCGAELREVWRENEGE
jgi:hypothetical protein